eukprot:416733-Rhodomonas_salina.1
MYCFWTWGPWVHVYAYPGYRGMHTSESTSKTIYSPTEWVPGTPGTRVCIPGYSGTPGTPGTPVPVRHPDPFWESRL